MIVLAAGVGCVDGSGPEGDGPGVARSSLEPDFDNVVGLCPETDDWGAWAQTPLSTWDSDVRPIVEWIIAETGISCSTYSGHDPSIGRAADWRPRSREEGTRLANWLQDHITGEAFPLGLRYVMWQAQIGFSDEIRGVEDRGSFTANHCDHVHMSFYDTVSFRPADVVPWDVEPEPDAGPLSRAAVATAPAPPRCVRFDVSRPAHEVSRSGRGLAWYLAKPSGVLVRA